MIIQVLKHHKFISYNRNLDEIFIDLLGCLKWHLFFVPSVMEVPWDTRTLYSLTWLSLRVTCHHYIHDYHFGTFFDISYYFHKFFLMISTHGPKFCPVRNGENPKKNIKYLSTTCYLEKSFFCHWLLLVDTPWGNNGEILATTLIFPMADKIGVPSVMLNVPSVMIFHKLTILRFYQIVRAKYC